MSEHGSNGSNGSIEEIGPEEIEESINENSEVLSEESSPNPVAADDPPLDTIELINVVAEPAAEEPTLPTESAPVESTPAFESDAVPESDVAPESDAVTEQAAPEPVAASAEVIEPIVVEDVEDVNDVEEVPRDPLPPAPQATQVRTMNPVPVDDEEEDDDDIDETLVERLVGLTEMFPESLRSGTVSLFKGSWSATQYLYGFSRSAGWIFFSTASILFMPVMIEAERLSIMDQQKQQKTQMLLGPGVASSGAPSLGPPPI